jgi:DNA-binding response OmpR family regulator
MKYYCTVVSASGQKQRVQEGLQAGADAYLINPLRIKELDGIIRSDMA